MNNPTGIEPTEFNVLVKLDEAMEKIGSLYMPESKQERDENLMVNGWLVSISPHAFSYADWPDDIAHLKPKVGDRVRISKGAGSLIEGPDAKYRLIKDKDVAAVVREPAKAAKVAA